MEIGKPKRIITVDPVKDPVQPRREPAPEPREPRPTPEKEPVKQ